MKNKNKIIINWCKIHKQPLNVCEIENNKGCKSCKQFCKFSIDKKRKRYIDALFRELIKKWKKR